MPSLSGESWFAVEWISSLPSFRLSHAQPLPKRFIAASANCFLNSSIDPKVLAMASPNVPPGAPPPGASNGQKKLWFT